VQVKPSKKMARAASGASSAAASTSSNSSVSVWQLQLLDVHSGDAVGWGTACRFRHALSGAYLSVSEAGAVSTTLTRSEQATVWLLVQNDLDEEARHVALGSFARIRHRSSGMYLVIGDAPEDDGGSLRSAGGNSLRRGTSKAGGSRFGGSARPGSQASPEYSGGGGGWHNLALASEASEKDVFAIEPVHMEAMRNLHRSQRMITVIRRYVQRLGLDNDSAADSATAGRAAAPAAAPAPGVGDTSGTGTITGRERVGVGVGVGGVAAPLPSIQPSVQGGCHGVRPPPEEATLVMIQVLEQLEP
jgi:hypothetical protein